MVVRRRQSFVALVLTVLAALSARADDKKLVVLPLDIAKTDGKMSAAARASVEELLRDAAIESLAAAGWTVLDANNTIELLRANNIDAAACEGSCHLETARKVAADAFVSGLVQWSDGEFTASIRLLDTTTGRPLATERVTGKTTKILRDAFWAKKDAFFRKLNGAPPPEAAAPPAAAVVPQAQGGLGTLKVISKPGGARVLLDGEELGTAPLSKQVAAGSYSLSLELDGFSAATRPVEVVAKKIATVTETLVKNTSFLEISLSPEGAAAAAAITIDGASGKLGQNGPFKSGPHLVRAQLAGYKDAEVSAEVAAGQTARVALVLEPALATLLLSVNLEATCSAAGKSAPATPGGPARLEVPPGAVHVVCTRPWYKDAARDAVAEAGKEKKLVFDLERDPETLKVELKTGLEFVRMPGGTFVFGDVSQDKNSRHPGKIITVGPFWIGKTLVTQEAYDKCVKNGPCDEAEPQYKCLQIQRQYDKPRPSNDSVNCIDWDQARKFCGWIGGRLLSAEEWEYAAKGGESVLFPWGDKPPDDVLLGTDADEPVGKFPLGATKAGLLDMVGNASTWTSTPDVGDLMVLRGGHLAYGHPRPWSNTESSKKDARDRSIGVRCALVL